jgi:hypothetical protein
MKSQTPPSTELMRALFGTIVEFMLKSGLSESDLHRLLTTSLARSRGNRKSRAHLPAGFDFAAAAAIKIWHHDRRYLTAVAMPKPVRLMGKAPSVEALAKKVCVSANQQDLVLALKSAGILKRTAGGKYLPSEAFATPQGLHPIAIQHIAKSVVRLVETAMRNTGSSPKQESLIERFARVPDLDVREAKAFAEFTRRQGLAYLQSVDDWLETRRRDDKPKGNRARRATTGAGVHLFAYIGDEVDDELSPGPEGLGEVSFRRSSWGVPSGNRRAVAPCTTSGAAA